MLFTLVRLNGGPGVLFEYCVLAIGAVVAGSSFPNVLMGVFELCESETLTTGLRHEGSEQTGTAIGY